MPSSAIATKGVTPSVKKTVWQIVRQYLLSRETATTKELYSEIRKHRPNFAQKQFHNRMTRLKQTKDIINVKHGYYALTPNGRYNHKHEGDPANLDLPSQAPREVKRTPRPKLPPSPEALAAVAEGPPQGQLQGQQFRIGDHVRIKNVHSSRSYAGQTGVITRQHQGSCGVKLRTLDISLSFDHDELEHITDDRPTIAPPPPQTANTDGTRAAKLRVFTPGDRVWVKAGDMYKHIGKIDAVAAPENTTYDYLVWIEGVGSMGCWEDELELAPEPERTCTSGNPMPGATQPQTKQQHTQVIEIDVPMKLRISVNVEVL